MIRKVATVKNQTKLANENEKLDKKPSYIPVLSTREKILEFLLVNRSISDKGWTVKEIACSFNLSTTTIRQNLVLLEKENLVIKLRIKNPLGHPTMAYTIHENAFDLFPKKYLDFSLYLISVFKTHYGIVELINLLRAVGITLAKKMVMTNSRIDHNKEQETFKQRLEDRLSLLTEFGYYLELTVDDSSYILKNYNCILNKIVQIEPLVCVACETLISEIIGKKITKISGNSRSNSPCIFRIEN